MNLVEYWVQIHGLPPEGYNMENVILIGSKIGEVVNVDGMDLHKPFLQLQMHFHVDHTLSPCFFTPRGSTDPMWVQFKHERLSNFCYTISSCRYEVQHPLQQELSSEMKGTAPSPQVFEVSGESNDG